jgi:hypothetical protein
LDRYLSCAAAAYAVIGAVIARVDPGVYVDGKRLKLIRHNPLERVKLERSASAKACR